MNGGDDALRRRLGDLAAMGPEETEDWLGSAGLRPAGPVRARGPEAGAGEGEPAGYAAGRRVVQILRTRTDDHGDDGRAGTPDADDAPG